MWGMVMWADISPTAPAGRGAAPCSTAHIGGCSPGEGALLRSRLDAAPHRRAPGSRILPGAERRRSDTAPQLGRLWVGICGRDAPWDTGGELE